MPTGTDIVISFDTTGSMYPCLSQVRREVNHFVDSLFDEIPNLRVGIIAHGDYCDKNISYVTRVFDLSQDKREVSRFVSNVEPTNGGDAPECYELVLHQARMLTWEAGSTRALIMIGDDIPHEPSYHLNTKNLDWRNELRCLEEMSINVHGIHAMPHFRHHSKAFYTEMAKMTGGLYLTLDQLQDVTNLLMGVIYKQSGQDDYLIKFEQELQEKRKMTHSMRTNFDKIHGRHPSHSTRYTTSSDEMSPVTPDMFQVMAVYKRVPIKVFVEENLGYGEFRKGGGFYQFGSKAVAVQDYKKVVLVDRDSGEMWTGKAARYELNLPETGTIKLYPREVNLNKYKVFIQSTSVNRILYAGEDFLYETR